LCDFTLNPGEKYSLIFIPTNFISNNIPSNFKINKYIWFLKSLPFNLPEHWNRWLGKIVVENLSKDGLFFITKKYSKTPNIVNDEDFLLKNKINDFYFCFLLTSFIKFSSRGYQITGSNNSGEITVNSFSIKDPPKSIPGFRYTNIDKNNLRISKSIYSNIKKMPRKKYFRRFNRALESYNLGLLSDDATIVIHNFVRCIEGFVLPEIGKTKRQFLSRVQVFLSKYDKNLLKEIFEIRSAVEHLHDPLSIVKEQSLRLKKKRLILMTAYLEVIARNCIQKVVLDKNLWEHFKDDISLMNFWKNNNFPNYQKSLWGNPINLEKIKRMFI